MEIRFSCVPTPPPVSSRGQLGKSICATSVRCLPRPATRSTERNWDERIRARGLAKEWNTVGVSDRRPASAAQHAACHHNVTPPTLHCHALPPVFARADNIDKGGNVSYVRSQTEVGSACTGRCHFFARGHFMGLTAEGKRRRKPPQSRRFARHLFALADA